MLNNFIHYYINVDDIHDKDAFISIINYNGSDKDEFLRNVFTAIGIPGDSENFDALYDDYCSFYWIKTKPKIFLVHESLPTDKDVLETYLDVLFLSIDFHIKERSNYTQYIDGQGYVYKREELYAYFKIEDSDLIKKSYKRFMKDEYGL